MIRQFLQENTTLDPGSYNNDFKYNQSLGATISLSQDRNYRLCELWLDWIIENHNCIDERMNELISFLARPLNLSRYSTIELISLSPRKNKMWSASHFHIETLFTLLMLIVKKFGHSAKNPKAFHSTSIFVKACNLDFLTSSIPCDKSLISCLYPSNSSNHVRNMWLRAHHKVFRFANIELVLIRLY